MLRDNSQLELPEYANIYELVIPKENIGFSFVNPMLKKSY